VISRPSSLASLASIGVGSGSLAPGRHRPSRPLPLSAPILSHGLWVTIIEGSESPSFTYVSDGHKPPPAGPAPPISGRHRAAEPHRRPLVVGQHQRPPCCRSSPSAPWSLDLGAPLSDPPPGGCRRRTGLTTTAPPGCCTPPPQVRWPPPLVAPLSTADALRQRYHRSGVASHPPHLELVVAALPHSLAAPPRPSRMHAMSPP
jgi:hypothetical protein